MASVSTLRRLRARSSSSTAARLTRSPRRLCRARRGYSHQPPAYCTYQRRRAACTQGPSYPEHEAGSGLRSLAHRRPPPAPEHASGYPALRPAAASFGQSASSAAPAGHSRPYRAYFPAQARLRPAVDPKRSCRLNVCAGGGGAADCAPCLSACVASCGSRSCRVLRMRRVYLLSSCTQRGITSVCRVCVCTVY